MSLEEFCKDLWKNGFIVRLTRLVSCSFVRMEIIVGCCYSADWKVLPFCHNGTLSSLRRRGTAARVNSAEDRGQVKALSRNSTNKREQRMKTKKEEMKKKDSDT